MEKRARVGKTKREHASGVHGNRFKNREKRVVWQKNIDPRNPGSNPFPVESCNGKKNRYRVTGKKGKSVILKEK